MYIRSVVFHVEKLDFHYSEHFCDTELLKGNQRTEPSNKLWRKTILSPLLIYNKSSDSQREVSQEDTWHSPTVGSLKVNLIMEQLEVKLSAVTRDDAGADELMRTKLNPSKFAKLIR